MILLLLLCSCWAIVLVDYFEPIQYFKLKFGLSQKRLLKSDRRIVDILIYTIWKILNCPSCMSYHLYWISSLVFYGNIYGIFYGILCYFITFIIKEKIMYIKL